MAYKGPERRIHTVFSTRNREYHVRSGICVAVRDLKTRVWISNHEAIGMQLKADEPGIEFMSHPLTFFSDFTRIRTSRVMDIVRPGRQTVNLYSLLWAVCPV